MEQVKKLNLPLNDEEIIPCQKLNRDCFHSMRQWGRVRTVTDWGFS